MTARDPRVTLIVGPQTRLGVALNDVARECRSDLERHGNRVLPSRIATRQLRAGIRGAPTNEVLTALLGGATPVVPTVLSAVNILGRSASAILNNELYPEAERRLNGSSEILGQFTAHVIIAPEALTDLVVSARSEQLERRVRGMNWDILYELGWPDLVQELLDAFPTSEVSVVLPESAVLRADFVVRTIFGTNHADGARHLQEATLSPAGRAALDGLRDAGTDTDETLRRLLFAHPRRPDPSELRARLGLDAITQDLLDQRFAEDVAIMRAMPRVTVI